jgi:hypothetical protein
VLIDEDDDFGEVEVGPSDEPDMAALTGIFGEDLGAIPLEEIRLFVIKRDWLEEFLLPVLKPLIGWISAEQIDPDLIYFGRWRTDGAEIPLFFARRLDQQKTLHRSSIDAAVTMMSSEQLAAFDIKQEPQAVREAFGDTPFGRGCLAAARLVEVGVRCIEVRLDGWDTHANNHDLQNNQVDILDPAFAALIDYLHQRDRLADTMILCCGEFGRTPIINPLAGRDHWPHGFSVAMAGGGIAGGRVLGETDPEGSKLEHPEGDELEPGKGVPIEHIHATVLHAMGIEYGKELDTPVGRPMALSKGQPIKELFGGV